MSEPLDTFDAHHFCTGRSLIVSPVHPNMEDNLSLWREIWFANREALIEFWESRHPGDPIPARELFESDDSDPWT